MGSRVYGLGFRVFVFRLSGVGFTVKRLRSIGLGFGNWGLGFWGFELGA